MLASPSWLCDVAMKLMGMSRLRDLPAHSAGAASALCKELAAADWKGPNDVAADYPLASVSGGRVRIGLGDAHCVVLVIRYEVQMTLIDYAGPVALADAPARARRGRAA